MTALVLLALAGCYDEDRPIQRDPPGPDPVALALEEGAYEVQVLDVVSLACDGQRPADVVGQSLYGQLFVEEDQAGLDLQGWFLEGAMTGGQLSLAGELIWDEPVPVDDGDTAVDDDPDTDSDTDVDTSPPDSGGGADERPDEDERPEELRGSMRLEAAIVSERLASGTLAVEMPGCAMELEVAMLFAGRSGGGEEPPVYEEVEPVPGSECDGADCG